MDFYKVIENRTSNKNFRDTKIPKEKLDRIINAALMAPSWKNNSCYRFIFVDEQRQKDQVSNTILNNTDETSNSVRQAPIIAIIVADPSKSGEMSNKLFYMVDCGIAMEHLVLASTNEGYGTCWIGSFDEDKVRNILNIPSKYSVVAMTPIGETDESIAHYPPKDMAQHISFNNWTD